MDQPNTLLISPYFDAGLPSGGVLYSIDVVREWLARGRQVHVACLNRPRTLADLEPHVASGQLMLHPIADAECGRFTHHPDRNVYAAMRELLRSTRPDLVHVHNTQGMLSAVEAAIDEHLPTVMTALDFGLLCFNFCLYPGSPQVCRTPLSAPDCRACVLRTMKNPARTLGPLLPRWATRRIWPRFVRMDQVKSVRQLHALMRRILTSVIAIIALSPGLADQLRQHGAAGGRVVHLLQGIGPEKMIRPPKELSESLRFGYIGGADPIKGFGTIVAAIELLPPGLPLRIRAIGGLEVGQIIKRSSPKASSYFEYHPSLFGRALADEHARLDAMLVPSIVHENSPSAARESLAAGTPVLGSDHPGISHLIIPNHNGWLIEPGNPAAWARAFIKAVQHPARIRAMQLNARYTRTNGDFINDVEWIERSLLGRATGREKQPANPPVAIYT